MYRNLPAIVHARSVPGKGTGLFTSKSVPAGELVFAIERPLVRIPDNEHLAKACYNCFYLEPPEGRSELETRTLKICNGCKVVKYCSKVCARTQSYCVQPIPVHVSPTSDAPGRRHTHRLMANPCLSLHFSSYGCYWSIT